MTTEMTGESPKPCICGGEAEIMVQQRNGWVWIRCSRCDQQTKAFRSRFRDVTVRWAVSEWDFKQQSDREVRL